MQDLSPAEVAARADCVFSCLPHGASAEVIPSLLAAGRRVVDFSADYRLNDAAVYEQWYGQKHADPDRLGKVVYGLPELFRKDIPAAQLVANPGCYPTSVILALAPLLKAGMIDPKTIIVDSKSGVSGAGRTLKLTTHYPECNESVSAYNVGRHRHQPEIDQILSAVGGAVVEVVFTPHLIPMDRGILSTTYSQPTVGRRGEDGFADDSRFLRRRALRARGRSFSWHERFAGYELLRHHRRVVRGRVLTFSCLDNLIKGAVRGRRTELQPNVRVSGNDSIVRGGDWGLSRVRIREIAKSAAVFDAVCCTCREEPILRPVFNFHPP